jgi:hypothetical protein
MIHVFVCFSFCQASVDEFFKREDHVDFDFHGLFVSNMNLCVMKQAHDLTCQRTTLMMMSMNRNVMIVQDKISHVNFVQ